MLIKSPVQLHPPTPLAGNDKDSVQVVSDVRPPSVSYTSGQADVRSWGDVVITNQGCLGL